VAHVFVQVWAIQNLAGNSFSGYSTYFLQQAGVPTSKSYDFALGQYGINMAGVFGAWFLMSWGVGRRTLYLYGLCGLCSMLFIMGERDAFIILIQTIHILIFSSGFLGLVPAAHRDAGALATGAIMICWAMIVSL